MGAVLVSRTLDGVAFEVRVVATRALWQEVSAFRRRVYVDELGILDADHPFVTDRGLEDPYDAWSTQLACLADGVVVGTARVTEGCDGDLEVEAYLDLAPHGIDRTRVAEMTRFMVAKAWRRTPVGPLIAYGMWRLLASRPGSRTGLVAGKLGNLGRYYQNAGFQLHDDASFCYELTGCQYQLLTMQTGAKHSRTRLYWHLRAEASLWVATRARRFFGPLFRRGFRRAGGAA
jgi:hypothetical protein